MAEDIVITIGGNVSKAEGMFGKLGGAVGGFSSMTLSNLNQVGATFSNLGAKISNFTDSIVNNFASFDQAMKNTQSVASEDISSMSKDAEKWAEQFGISAIDVANGMYQVASAGFSTKEQLKDMTPVLLTLAKATGSDFAQASVYATDMMKGFGKEAGDLKGISDLMMGTIAQSKNTIDTFGNAMSYAAPSAYTLGWSMQETSAMIGAFADMGIKGTRAGTAMRMMTTALLKPTESSMEAISKLSESLYDEEGKVKSLTDVLRILNESNIESADVMEIFGARAGPYLSGMLAEGGKGLRKYNDLMESLSHASEDGGATQKAFEIQMEGVGNELAVLASRLENAKRQFGEEFTPATKFATETEIKFYEIIGKLPGPLLEVGGGMMVIAGNAMSTIGPMIQMATSIMTLIMLKNADTASTSGGTIAKIAHTIATWAVTAATWAWNAALMANPIVWIIIAIAALIAVIYLLWKHWDEVTAAVKGVWDVLINWLKPAIDAVGGAMAWLNEHIIKPISDALTWLYEHVIAGIILYIYLWKLGFEALGAGLKWVYENTMKPVFDSLAWVYENVIKPIAEGIGGIVEGVGGFFGGAGDIMGFAGGGFAASPMIARIAETEPEWIVPQSKVGSFIGAMTSGGGGGGDTFYIENVNVKADTPREFIQAMKSEKWRGKGVGA
jgi:TP901 family phage tail tape measure protein